MTISFSQSLGKIPINTYVLRHQPGGITPRKNASTAAFSICAFPLWFLRLRFSFSKRRLQWSFPCFSSTRDEGFFTPKWLCFPLGRTQTQLPPNLQTNIGAADLKAPLSHDLCLQHPEILFNIERAATKPTLMMSRRCDCWSPWVGIAFLALVSLRRTLILEACIAPTTLSHSSTFA